MGCDLDFFGEIVTTAGAAAGVQAYFAQEFPWS
jgi:hypothetical protein